MTSGRGNLSTTSSEILKPSRSNVTNIQRNSYMFVINIQGSPDLKLSHINFSVVENYIQNSMFELFHSKVKSFLSFQMKEHCREFRIVICVDDSSLRYCLINDELCQGAKLDLSDLPIININLPLSKPSVILIILLISVDFALM